MFEPETSGLHSKPALSTIVRVPSSTDKNKTHRRTRTVNNEESSKQVIKYKNIFEPFQRKKFGIVMCGKRLVQSGEV